MPLFREKKPTQIDKETLFEKEVNKRPSGRIMLSDLHCRDLATLDSSGMFWIPVKDKSNRGILFVRFQDFAVSHENNLVSY